MINPVLFPTPVTSSHATGTVDIDPSWEALFAEMLDAVREDNMADARSLLAIGAPVRSRNTHGQCVLACAVTHASPNLVGLLLDAGADPNGVGVNDHPILTLAAGRNAPEICKILMEAGADPNARRALTGETALHVAATYGHEDVARVLVEAGTDISARADAEVETDLFPGGRWVAEETALHRAAESASRSFIRWLLSAGASPSARTMLGETPQSWARRAHRDQDVIKMLRYP